MKHPIRLMRVKPDHELETLRVQYDGPGAFFITMITMTGKHLIIPEVIIDALSAETLGKVCKAMNDLYQLVIVREQTPPPEVVIEQV